MFKKLILYWHAIAITLLLVIGYILYPVMHPPRIVPVEIVVQTDTISRVDTLKTCDTVLIPGRTIIITDTTRIGDLPWLAYDSQEQIIIKSDNNQYPVRFQLRRWIKGLDGGYEIYPLERTFVIKTKQPSVNKVLNFSIMGIYNGEFNVEATSEIHYKTMIVGGGWATDRKWFGSGGITFGF